MIYHGMIREGGCPQPPTIPEVYLDKTRTCFPVDKLPLRADKFPQTAREAKWNS